MSEHPSDQDFDLWSMQTVLKYPPEVIDVETSSLVVPKITSIFHGMREFMERASAMRVKFPDQAENVAIDGIFDGLTCEASVDLKSGAVPLAWIIRFDMTVEKMLVRGVMVAELASDCSTCGIEFHTVKEFGKVSSCESSDFLLEFYGLTLTVLRDFENHLKCCPLVDATNAQSESSFYPRLRREFLGLF